MISKDLEGGAQVVPQDVTRVGLETLEQRILLAGDVAVVDPQALLHGTDNGVNVGQDSASAAQASPAPAPASSVAPAGQPLRVLGPGGTSQDAASLPLGGGALTLQSGQSLVGSGSLGAAVVNAGVVAPGSSPGVLSVTGFEQGAGATLKMEIGGLHPGLGQVDRLDGYDQIDVSGRAVLGGTLALELIDDFRPVAGQVFDILKWQERSGSFTSYTGLYAGNGLFLKPVYQADRLQLVATPVAGLTNLSFAETAEVRATVDRWLGALTNSVAVSGLQIDASLDLPGLRLSGTWGLSVAPLGQGGVEARIEARDASAAWSVGGLTGSLETLTGSITIGSGTPVFDLSGHGSLVLPGGDGRLA